MGGIVFGLGLERWLDERDCRVGSLGVDGGWRVERWRSEYEGGLG